LPKSERGLPIQADSIREGVESDLNLIGLTILMLLAGEFEGLFAEFDPGQAEQAAGRRLWVGEGLEGSKRDHLRRFLDSGVSPTVEPPSWARRRRHSRA